MKLMAVLLIVAILAGGYMVRWEKIGPMDLMVVTTPSGRPALAMADGLYEVRGSIAPGCWMLARGYGGWQNYANLSWGVMCVGQ